MHSQWDPWVTVGVPMFGLAALVCVGMFVVAYNLRKSDEELAEMLVFWGCLGLVVGTVIAGLVYFPYEDAYFKYVPKTGVVQSISTRLMADGHGSTQRVAVVYEDGTVYGCDDTRCTTLYAGERITLMCEKEYQFVGTAGYQCNWGRKEP